MVEKEGIARYDSKDLQRRQLKTERTEAATASTHMSHSLNSLKGGYIGDYIGDQYRGYGGY